MVLRHIPASLLDHLDPGGGQLAFWINAYNELVALGLTALKIRETVWEVPDFFDQISLRAGAFVFSANDIEHGILRANRTNPLSGRPPFGTGDPRHAYATVPLDPRIHFAINCGARSCPPVRRYEGQALDRQLDHAARAYVSRHVRLKADRLVAPPIFKWFAGDFADWPRGLAGFLIDHLEDGPTRRALFQNGITAIAWAPYDWRRPQAVPAGGREDP
jgi:hypothetical protein